MSQHIPDCNCFVCKGRELETLKVQLAQTMERSQKWADACGDAYRKLSESEAQVRELRELLWLRHGCSLNRLYGDDGEMQCADCLLDFKRDSVEEISERWKTLSQKALKAALRPAPPSDPKLSEWDFDIPRDNRFHDWPIDKTNAGEERQDLASSPLFPTPHV